MDFEDVTDSLWNELRVGFEQIYSSSGESISKERYMQLYK